MLLRSNNNTSENVDEDRRLSYSLIYGDNNTASTLESSSTGADSIEKSDYTANPLFQSSTSDTAKPLEEPVSATDSSAEPTTSGIEKPLEEPVSATDSSAEPTTSGIEKPLEEPVSATNLSDSGSVDRLCRSIPVLSMMTNY